MTTELTGVRSCRSLLRQSAGAGATVALAATGCHRFGGGASPVTSAAEINVVWWGDAARARSTQALLDLRDHLDLATEVMFERVTPADAAKQFTGQAAKILKANNS